jgi:predicted nucleic acid-binding protein
VPATRRANYRVRPIQRVPAVALIGRAYELHANATANGLYVALVELLGCVLLTGDTRRAATRGVRCPIEVVA